MSTDSDAEASNADAEGRSRDWPWLDDLVSAAVLLSVALAIPAAAVAVTTGVIDVDVALDFALVGQVDVGLLFYALVILAVLDVYGRRRVQAARQILGNLAQNYNPRDEEGRGDG